MKWSVLKQSASPVTEDQFWTAVKIWKENAHVVNRRVSSIVEIHQQELTIIDFHHIKLLILNHTKMEKEVIRIGLNNVKLVLDSIDLKQLLEINMHLSIRKVLPRNSDQFHECVELVLQDRVSAEATFINLTSNSSQCVLPKIAYRISFKSGSILLEALSQQEDSDRSYLWLISQLLPRIEKWALNAQLSTKGGFEFSSQSLSQVNKEKYNTLYQSLKKKYGQEMVKIWPECTDPAKFVYEDVAIATYLLLLWEEEKQERCSFVDLGCGNGLLVHILNSEGHQGVGLDVRGRKIWSLFPATTKLKVETIVPSEKTLFPDADWLIGNHSDELTPWIPVMAARSSQKTRYFVLPCCPYEFDGRKFNRKDASQSQYNAYLQYVQKISEECGFRTFVDRLRIPSTKRICLIGRERTYDDWTAVNDKIKDVIRQGCLNGTNNVDNDQWVANFKPREKEETVRNCTKVDRLLQDSIVRTVVDQLLSDSCLVDSERVINSKWNAGGTLSLGEVVKLISSHQLKLLKSECGGVQTLLRNHHQIFKVEGGKVELRRPQSKNDYSASSKRPRLGTKPCWFNANHPDGCLLPDDVCSFAH